MNELKLLENDLVPVYVTSTGEKVVYGSELHAVLGAPSVYREWVKRRLTDIDAMENKEFEGVEISTPSGQTRKDHIIKLDTAKEMAMLERNEKGKQVRRYFIKVEDKYKELLISGKINQNSAQARIDAQIDSIMKAGSMVNLSRNQKIDLIKEVYESNGVPVSFLDIAKEPERPEKSLSKTKQGEIVYNFLESLQAAIMNEEYVLLPRSRSKEIAVPDNQVFGLYDRYHYYFRGQMVAELCEKCFPGMDTRKLYSAFYGLKLLREEYSQRPDSRKDGPFTVEVRYKNNYVQMLKIDRRSCPIRLTTLYRR